ncbi:MAG: hypothetical protein JSW01_00720 [Candidatus Bathyarchaeota archaeon]|nr:MAG: hypothetical protein JSW01_00720 [Candidatus Bathyarchaeota archaeon]
MRSRRVLPILTVLMVFSSVLIVPASARVTTNERIYWARRQWIPCAMDGAGESVYLSGYLHIVFSTTLDGKGGFHTRIHHNPQGITGIGELSGDKYQAVGETRTVTNGKIGETYTFVNNYKIIGQGRGNNLLIHDTIHYTVNVNGEVTSDLANTSVECR